MENRVEKVKSTKATSQSWNMLSEKKKKYSQQDAPPEPKPRKEISREMDEIAQEELKREKTKNRLLQGEKIDGVVLREYDGKKELFVTMPSDLDEMDSSTAPHIGEWTDYKYAVDQATKLEKVTTIKN